jgi:hypothetical protein
MRIGLPVGLREGGDGEPLHGVIDSLDQSRVHIWIPDSRYSPALPKNLRGYLTALTYQQAEAGAMWAEPRGTDPPAPGGTSGAHLLAYWRRMERAGLVAHTTAAAYRTAIHRVLAAQPDGEATDIAALDPARAIARFTAAHRDTLSASTLIQYASGFRRARRLFLSHATGQPGAADLIACAAALRELARAWQRAAEEKNGDGEHDAAAALADAVLALPAAPPRTDAGGAP